MAAEEDVIIPSSAHHTISNIVEKSNEDDNEVQKIPQIVEEVDSNVLVHGDNDFGNNDVIDTLPEVGSHEVVGMTTHTRTRDSSSRSDHTPTPCQNTNHLRIIIMQATQQPMCTTTPELVDPGLQPVEPGLEHVILGLELVSNTSGTANRTVDDELYEGDNETIKEGMCTVLYCTVLYCSLSG